ncbi:MAG: MBL fold metallo-hydrolase [Gammaproteobacteria bacterium]|nr:MBL fold metallo-hydrolase [Gammaproteobacteria bacterium]
MKKFVIGIVALAVAIGLLGLVLLNTAWFQDRMLRQGAKLVMSAPAADAVDALRVFVCGSSSPLPAPGRAQACIAILTPEHFYLIDSGARSTVNLGTARLPMARLDGILLTHFHSDHIAEIYEVNLNSWVQGRAQPLTVTGPAGVSNVVDGINATYAMDVGYRVAHHSAELLPPALGVLQAKTITPGVVVDSGGLRIEAIEADHAPISPAVAYRIDYQGRTVLVTGDTVITEAISAAAQNLDLLLTDTLSLPIILTLSEQAKEAGRTRNAKILKDVTDYHASTDSIIALIEKANVKLTGYYHLVPPPSNIIMRKIYERDLPDNAIITDDGMWFELRVGGTEVAVTYP